MNNNNKQQNKTLIQKQINQRKKNQDDTMIKQLQMDVQNLTIQLSRVSEKSETQSKRKSNSEKLQEININFLQDIQYGSHYNVVIHILEQINGFSDLLQDESDEVCRTLTKLFGFIREKKEQKSLQQDIEVINKIIPPEELDESKANDMIFQIIDYLSKVILKNSNDHLSPIAKIIQADDSPIYEMFFFLQRIYPIDEESHFPFKFIIIVQDKETPLINSVKHVKFAKDLIFKSQTFSQYLKELIQFEGEENVGGDGLNYNFVFIPQVLFLNILELSQYHPALKIDQVIEESCLNSDSNENNKYRLLAIIHSSQNNNVQIYYLTIRINNVWVHAFGDKYEIVQDIESILTFQNKQNDIELLVYQRE